MRKSVILLCLISIYFNSFSQLTWLNRKPQGNALNDVFFIDNLKGVSVGECGAIVETIDGGLTWINKSLNNRTSLNAVNFIDVNIGVIVGDSGLIIRTDDSGFSWESINSGTNFNLFDVYFINSNIGYIVGESGTILKSVDSGISWSLILSNTTNRLNTINFISTSIGIIAGENGTILRTIDGGSTWNQIVSNTNSNINSITFTNNNIIFIVGNETLILSSNDFGLSWNIITNDPLYLNYNDISFLDSLNGIIITDNGSIVKTFDGGISWLNYQNLFKPPLYSIFKRNNNSSTIVGVHGTILNSSNNWDNWTEASSGTINGFQDIFFTDSLTGYFLGNKTVAREIRY